MKTQKNSPKEMISLNTTHRPLFIFNITNLLIMPILISLLIVHIHIPISTSIAICGGIGVSTIIYTYQLDPIGLFRFLCQIIAQLFYRIHIFNAHFIPKKGPVVLVANHISYIDWLIISVCIQRPVRFVMHHTFLKVPFTKRLFKEARIIPIASAKENPNILENAFQQIQNELADGQVVCIFPEGKLTRDGNMNPFKSGIERIIKKSPVPVVPMALNGLWESMFSLNKKKSWFSILNPMRLNIELKIGEPVSPATVTADSLYEHVKSLK
ncbi:MAG: 1-acyl-sn-glycerol-3-phosphate acyltransferase [Desulfobacterales bacterium]|nr:1-acyl-sn-glycerol-3-phosphate acyltransferase [Desulfobacterales bacterium]